MKLASILVDGDRARLSGVDDAHTVGPEREAAAQLADDVLAFGRIAHELFAGTVLPDELRGALARSLEDAPANRPTAVELASALGSTNPCT